MQQPSRSSPKLLLKVNRSLRPSQHLFDYDSFISQEVHPISCSSIIYHRNPSSSIYSSHNLNPQDLNLGKQLRIVNLEQIKHGDVPGRSQQPIISLRMLSSQKFMLSPFEQAEKEDKDNDLYLSVRKGMGPSKGYSINAGNVIKFGKIAFKIVEASFGQHKQCSLQNIAQQIKFSNESVSEIEQNLAQGASCRICLSDQQQESDPLLTPCNCRGSCQYVHLGCLKEWLNNKVMHEDNGFVKIINLNKFECQICKKAMPTTLKIRKQLQQNSQNMHQIAQNHQSLLNFSKPKGPYLILDRITSGANQILYCLDFTNTQEIKIGRNLTSTLRLSDITVSRSHASIFLSKTDGFLLKDDESKFGTLIRIDDQIAITYQTMIQRGQRVYSFSKEREMHPMARVYMM